MKLTDEKIAAIWTQVISSAAKGLCYDVQLRFARAILKEAGMEELERDVENYLSVMAAAAVEIDEQWAAHCDEEGYGPVNLMRRLEQGFPEHYGYRVTEWESLCSDAARYRWLRSKDTGPSKIWECTDYGYELKAEAELDAAIDEAMKAK